MRILAIETSCDETSAAVVEYRHRRFCVLSNVVSSQINIHQKFGGVVPEVAARKQVELIIPVMEEALIQAQHSLTLTSNKKADLKEYGSWKIESRTPKKQIFQIPDSRFQILPHLDALAVTAGPGLMIALSVGVETARTLAVVWKKPIVAINHLEGHLYSALLPKPSLNRHAELVEASLANESRHPPEIPRFARNDAVRVNFPAIALIVSGGHTELILVKDYLDHKPLGRTRDDAAGEAYDKVAKLLGLGYPGGPIIDRLALQGDPTAFNFPRGMIHSGDYDFSFAGLKTAVLYTLQKLANSHRHPGPRPRGSRKKNKQKIDVPFGFLDSRLRGVVKQSSTTPLRGNDNRLLNNLCASFQAAVVDVLVAKTIRAAQHYKARTILLGGGVAANSQLRKQLSNKIQEKLPNTKYLIPDTSFTTDNAAMIAAAAALHATQKHFTPWQKLKADPNLTL